MVLWDRAVLPYPFDFDTCIKVKLDSSWRIHTKLSYLNSVGKLGFTDAKAGATLCFDFSSPNCVHVFSEFLKFGESSVMFKWNKFKYNWHNVKNSYHSYLFTNAVSSSVFFLRRVASLVGVLAWLVGLLGLLRGGTLSLAFQFLQVN